MLGKVVLITGAARGQGRSHAVGFAQRGADVIAVDLPDRHPTYGRHDAALNQPYALGNKEDLLTTHGMVRECGRRMWISQVDVRDEERLYDEVAQAVLQFGRLDFVLANAGINPIATDRANTHAQFVACLDVMVEGVFNTIEAALPHLLTHGDGGAIVITSSTTGLKSQCPTYARHHAGLAGYTAAKHAVVGLMRHYATALAEKDIRVNTVHPAGVATDMVLNPAYDEWFGNQPTALHEALSTPLPVRDGPYGLLPAQAVTDLVLHLCSHAGRYITGTTASVDAGYGAKC